MCGPISRHFWNLCIIIFFAMLKFSSIMTCNKVDSNSFSAPSSRPTYTMQISMLALWYIKVDYNTYLLNMYSSCKQVRSDLHSTSSRLEFFMNCFTLCFIHFTMNLFHRKFILYHSFL